MPESIFDLCDEITESLAALQPHFATEYGIAGHDHRWDDFGPEGASIMIATLEELRERVDVAGADGHWGAVARRAAADYLDKKLTPYLHDDHLHHLNSIWSPAQWIRDVFDIMDTTTAKGWQDIASRLEGLQTALAGYRETLELGRSRSLTAPERQVRAVIRQASHHGGEESFFRGLGGAVAAALPDDGTLVQRVADGAEAARLAYSDFAAYLERDYLGDARPADGVGPDVYVRKAAEFLGATIDPAAEYARGWEDVSRIRAEMTSVAGEIRPGASRGEALEILKTDPARCAPDPESFLRLMSERQEQALANLAGIHFDVPEQIRRVEVKLAPPGGPLGAYYVGPSEDFSRPGSIWYSIGDSKVIPLYDEVTTAYHEGFPGHHLQTGVQVSLADRLSRLHRTIVWWSGYGEGWALYTERLMHELGYLEKPDYVMGLLAAQMLRACRVVIDIGSHCGFPIPEGQPFHPGEDWSFDTAVEMLMDDAALERAYAESEVTRYLGWPGQAISYRIGERVILDLREQRRQAEGDAFDLKRFHSDVLGAGPVGLDMLRELIAS